MPESEVFVRLLGGPVEVLQGTERVALARRPAAVLAALALRLNVPVSYGVIAELLWSPDELPASPRRAIQTYASRLREVIGRDAVVAHGDGLRLQLDPDRVDLYRFRRLVDTDTDSPREELDALSQALDLWTGAPLSGLGVDQLAEVERPALLDEILNVAERRNELRLRLGDLDEAFIASLRRLTAEHPWRERTWCHLMLALYRTGRQGEALSTFTDLVGVLRDGLGIDPGADATQLHQRMLATDPHLLEPAAPAAPPAATAEPPAQLPAGSPAFVGRRRELAELAALLDRPADRVRVAVVSGPAGVGKTTTVIEAAHRARARFPDGQLYTAGSNSGTGVPARDLLGTFLRDLGTTSADIPASLADRAALFRSLCARRRLLIVLDDAHSADQITDLLPGAGDCAVLVTSRRRIAVPANLTLDLDTITTAESHELLATLAGAARLAAEPDATAAIIHACAGSPLALHIIGGRLATRPAWPLAHLRDRLTGPGRLAELRLDGHSVQAVLDATTSTLDPTDATRFHTLATLPVNLVDVETAAALWEIGRPDARDLLEHLSDIRLLEPAVPGCYSWHDLIGSYLRDQPGPADHAARRRMLRQAIASITNARDRLRPGDRPHQPIVAAITAEADGVVFTERGDVHAWLHPRLPLILTLARDALTSPDEDQAVEAAALTPTLDAVLIECCGTRNSVEELLRAVTGTPLPPAAAHFVAASWQNLATVQSQRGQFMEAQAAAQRAIALWRQLGDRFGEGAMLNNLAVLHERMGDYATAVQVARRCVAAVEAQPVALRIRCQLTFAQVLARQGDLDEARDALAVARAVHLPEPGSLDAHMLRTAETYLQLGGDRPADAILAAQKAIAAAREMRSDQLTGQSTVLLARARRLAGQDSQDTAAAALQLLLGLPDVQATCEALIELAHAHHARGDLHSADACAAEAARLADQAGLDGTPWADALLAQFATTPQP
ncbi:AfsR/SARP family transcriptional regulator [Jiangella alkaliphila]|uniref:DNA-binding transcriptional activator of the SARP family n=2 Tax=Jiangella alkaliphila TaxID=419479 RepID=A0A1H2LCY3_9ACTN|nr:BTAD domain-containing putative transcriptional regulator [Jiangella alkaliphila]SDU78877.1 DNA-binding transcriptional activator of the SARP family [Jiangella alkaliphila]